MQLKTVKELKSLKNTKVLLRLDLDVPVDHDGKVHANEDWRIESALPTIKLLLKKGAEIIIIGHRGRPGGRPNPSLTLKPVADRLKQLLEVKGPLSVERVGGFNSFSFLVNKKWITVIENLRFFPGEEKNTKPFAKDLADLADIYVNESFATSHRSHASVEGITKLLPSYAGLRLAKEFDTLYKVLKRPRRPLTLIIGGVKGKTKIKVIEQFLPRADYILIGSAFAGNFYKTMGYSVGSSIIDDDLRIPIQTILDRPKYRILEDTRHFPMLINAQEIQEITPKVLRDLKRRIIIPPDLILGVAGKQNKPETVTVSENNYDLIPPTHAALDIGPLTSRLYQEIIKRSGTIIWNGPMGMFEQKPYDVGTNIVAEAVAASKAKSIIGGGDTVAAVESDHIAFKQNTFTSTGGGAMLDFLLDYKLPGIKPLLLK